MHWWMGIGLIVAGCTEPLMVAVDGPRPVFAPEEPGFFSTPWPSDTRLDEDGTLDVSAFPNPFDAVLLQNYLDRIDRLHGFGTNSPVYVLLDGPLPAERMPDPAASLEARAPVMLIDVDPESPHRGEQIPVQWEQTAFDDSAYQPQHLLAVAPVFGFPLRPATTYALVLTVEIAAPNLRWAARLSSDHPEHDRDLARALRRAGLRPEEVAIATSFTTQDPLDELARIAAYVRELPDRGIDDPVLERVEGHRTYISWATAYRSPVFTEGEPPYSNRGGGFAFDDAGQPEIVRWDDMRLSVCTPRGLDEPPSGWPVVIYQHGTGGHYRGFCNSSNALEVMHRLGEVGILGVGIDQPLHGTRPGAETAGGLAHFNLVNPESGVTNFRQGAVDLIYLARQLARRPHAFTAPSGTTFTTDPDRVMFMGHSQGGLTGALAGPFIGQDVTAGVLSGAGAVLSITVVERKDVLDFASLVRDLTSIEDDEPFTELHPIQGMIQTLVEPTDPANYAPYWFSEPLDWPGHTPLPMLVTSGTDDEATPWRTTVALAAAGRAPLVGAAATDVGAIRIRTGAPAALPQRRNAEGFDGSALTAGLHQYAGGTHFVVFEEPSASDLYTAYLRSAADGAAEISD